jgi:hypothetical protein
MQTSITLIFGSDAIRKYFNNETLSSEEISLNRKTFTFPNRNEAGAFLQGIEIAQGWQEVICLEDALQARVENVIPNTAP